MEETEQVPTTLYIDGFIKPFSVEEVKALVSEIVSPINMEEDFYMNGIKTFCYVTYRSMEDAKKAMENLFASTLSVKYRNGRQFPLRFGNRLHVRITSVSAKSMKRENPSRSSNTHDADSARNNEERAKKNEPEVVSIEDLFRKTRARPEIFYKPLTEEEVLVLCDCHV